MPTATLSVNWNTFGRSQGDLILSPSEFKEQWLYGIPLCNPSTGQIMPESTYVQKILAAQAKVEQELGLKLFKQYITETKDFVREEWMNWGFLKSSWQILSPVELNGRLNERHLVSYPQAWLTVRRSNANANSTSKELQILPNGEETLNFTNLFVAYPHYFNHLAARMLPNYWQMGYVTGFSRIPQDIIELIGLVSAIYILPILEFTVGATSSANYGLASSSLSLDGLSQSASKANGGNIFQQRLKDYGDRLNTSLTRMKGQYGGIKFDVC